MAGGADSEADIAGGLARGLGHLVIIRLRYLRLSSLHACRLQRQIKQNKDSYRGCGYLSAYRGVVEDSSSGL